MSGLSEALKAAKAAAKAAEAAGLVPHPVSGMFVPKEIAEAAAKKMQADELAAATEAAARAKTVETAAKTGRAPDGNRFEQHVPKGRPDIGIQLPRETQAARPAAAAPTPPLRASVGNTGHGYAPHGTVGQNTPPAPPAATSVHVHAAPGAQVNLNAGAGHATGSIGGGHSASAQPPVPPKPPAPPTPPSGGSGPTPPPVSPTAPHGVINPIGVATNPKTALTHGLMSSAREFMKDFLDSHPRIKTITGRTAAIAVAAAGVFFVGGKGLQTIEAGRTSEPGEFMAISTLHYTQGYDLDATNGSSFANTVEIARKDINPTKYVQRYDEKSKEGWVPTSAAQEAYSKAKADLAKTETSRAKEFNEATKQQLSQGQLELAKTKALVQKNRADASAAALASRLGSVGSSGMTADTTRPAPAPTPPSQ